MKRHVGIFAVLALLALPLVAGAQQIEGSSCRSWDDQGCMPSWWTPTPPMGGTVGMTPGKPLVTPREQTRLTQAQVATPAPKEVSSQKGTQIEVTQLIQWLAQKGVLTAQESAMLQQGKIPSTPVTEGRGAAPFPSPEELVKEYLHSPSD